MRFTTKSSPDSTSCCPRDWFGVPQDEQGYVALYRLGRGYAVVADGCVGVDFQFQSVDVHRRGRKPGKDLSIQMTVMHGLVTLLSAVQGAGGKLSLLVAEGESVGGRVLQIGNTNSRDHFSIGAKKLMNDWSKAGPAHHCAVSIGHIASKLEKLAVVL